MLLVLKVILCLDSNATKTDISMKDVIFLETKLYASSVNLDTTRSMEDAFFQVKV